MISRRISDQNDYVRHSAIVLWHKPIFFQVGDPGKRSGFAGPEIFLGFESDPTLTYLQLPLRQWGADNVYLLVLSS
jgi:hypothetical protein